VPAPAAACLPPCLPLPLLTRSCPARPVLATRCRPRRRRPPPPLPPRRSARRTWCLRRSCGARTARWVCWPRCCSSQHPNCDGVEGRRGIEGCIGRQSGRLLGSGVPLAAPTCGHNGRY
jgi:hypothetical protein